jgi:hypothetical protein
MMKPNRRARVADAKAKRQKISIIVGSGILALVLVIQVPKMMSLLSPGGASASAASQPASTTTTSAQTDTTSSAATTVAAPPATPAVATDASVNEPKKTPRFDGFDSKDPFAPQLTTTEQAASAANAGSGSSGAGAQGTDSTGVVPASAPSAGTATSAAPEQLPAPAPADAVISVNGVPATVAVGAAFPTSDPVFRLMKLGRTAAKIAIADGSYTSGAKAVSLALHASVTLLNTATGARYRLELLSVAP